VVNKNLAQLYWKTRDYYLTIQLSINMFLKEKLQNWYLYCLK